MDDHDHSHPHPAAADEALPENHEVMETAIRELRIKRKLIAPGEIRRQIEVLDSRTTASVSYTHLDVYKGQFHGNAGNCPK